MEIGDRCLFYHSNEGKAVVGIAEVIGTAYLDPTITPEEKAEWAAVDVAPVVAFPNPVTLAQLRAEPELSDLQIFKQMRLSVVSVTKAHYELILKMGGL
jgi:predicted RNA-binding protein with PUA-like domain